MRRGWYCDANHCMDRPKRGSAYCDKISCGERVIKVERIIRPFDQYRPEEQLLADSRVDSGHILATGSAIRNRRWAHGLWLVSTAISSILVLIAFVTPSVITVSAQA